MQKFPLTPIVTKISSSLFTPAGGRQPLKGRRHIRNQSTPACKTCASVSPKYWTTFDDAQAKNKKVAVLFTKMSTLTPKNVQPPRPRTPMGRSSPNYLVPPGVCSTLSQNFTPIAPSCVEISSTVQTKNSKLNITPNATLYGEIIIDN